MRMTPIFILLFITIFATEISRGQNASLVGESGRGGGGGMTLGNVSLTYQTPPRARTFEAEDLIQVIVNHRVSYNDVADLQRQKKIKSKMGITDLFKFISPFEVPVPIDTDPPVIGGEIDSQNRSKGNLSTRQSISLVMSGRIVAVLPNKTLQIEATRDIGFGDSRRITTITGIIRPEDVSPDNTVMSDRISHIEMDEIQTGTVSESVQRNYGTKWMDRWMPF